VELFSPQTVEGEAGIEYRELFDFINGKPYPFKTRNSDLINL